MHQDPESDAAKLREMHGRLLATAEVVERHFAEAVEVKRQLDDLVAALGAAAERAARDAGVRAPGPPRFESRAAEVRDVGVE